MSQKKHCHFHIETGFFEHRHENKNVIFKVFKFFKVSSFQVFQNILGSQLLSDIQTFFHTTFTDHPNSDMHYLGIFFESSLGGVAKITWDSCINREFRVLVIENAVKNIIMLLK